MGFGLWNGVRLLSGYRRGLWSGYSREILYGLWSGFGMAWALNWLWNGFEVAFAVGYCMGFDVDIAWVTCSN